jgi:hypothetical protein
MKDPTLQRIFGLSGGDSPDGLGHSNVVTKQDGNYATRETVGPGAGLEHVPLYAKGFMPTHIGRAGPIGQTETKEFGLISGLTVLIVNAASGAVVGMALAPSRDKRTVYAITGSVLSLVFGPLGMMSQAAFVLLQDRS